MSGIPGLSQMPGWMIIVAIVTGLLILAFVAKVAVALVYLALKKKGSGGIISAVTLESTQQGDQYKANKSRIDLEGAVGVAATHLRPAGIALINDERIDVITEGAFIRKDEPLRVVKIDGLRVVVEAIEGKW